MKERIDWELQKENQEKKIIARSARNKVTHTGCKLPSDFMTKKEKMAMNGKVVTMEMNKPVKYQAFKLWPADLQREYLENLVKIFGVGIDSIGEMMGCHRNTFRQFIRSRNLRDVFPKRNSPTKFRENGWKLFCDGVPYPFETKTEETTAQNAPESLENALEATNSVEEGTDTKEEFDTVKSPIEAEKAVIDSLNEQVRKKFSETSDTIHNAIQSVGDSLNAFGSKTFKAEEHYDSVEPEQETYPMTFTLFSFDMRDVKSWDDIFEMLRKFPLPEKNVLSVAMSERYLHREDVCCEKL